MEPLPTSIYVIASHGKSSSRMVGSLVDYLLSHPGNLKSNTVCRNARWVGLNLGHLAGEDTGEKSRTGVSF